MQKKFRIVSLFAGLFVFGAGFMVTRAQDPVEAFPQTALDRPELTVSDPSCTFFGPQREKMLQRLRNTQAKSDITVQVVSSLAPADAAMAALGVSDAAGVLPSPPGGSRTDTIQRNTTTGTIDRYIFDALSAAGVAPAPATTDLEFVRRVYLDLTGRTPTSQQVTDFVASTDTAKRKNLVDSLVGSANWIDKWTMWFGDMFNNNSANTQIRRYMPGVLALDDYIRTSLTANKSYDKMARELISAQGMDSWTQGELGFVVGGFMGGGPQQDIFDQQTALIMETFMGISHLNCLLCHDGRGHLDSLSLWGYYTTRKDAWAMSSFMSHTWTLRTAAPGAVNGNPNYWGLQNNQNIGAGRGLGRGYDFQNDYPLNTTTGNRPARAAIAVDPGNTAAGTARVKPVYVFDGTSPAAGQDYRTFLAQKITGDFQFARATVNYMWEYFFGIGLVTPSNQFDPERLDPDHPPSDCPSKAPCTLQASNPRLLNALAQDFINSGYDLRALQKEIVNSRAYQLSSRYEGAWSVANQTLFARHLVRRLWAEEIHDSIVQSSNVIPTYAGNYTYVPGDVRQWGPKSYAMQFPEPLNTPDNGGVVSQFLDAFMRGNRDDEARKGEGSISQALNLMNDNFVMSRINSTAATSLIQTALKITDDTQMVTTLYMSALSRPPTQAELTAALANLKAPNNRTAEAKNLLWSLYNSVSFTFNY